MLQAPGSVLYNFYKVLQLVRIFLIHIFGAYDKVRTGSVVGNGNIVNLRDTKQGFHIRIMRLRGKGIRKEYHEVDLPVYDPCADLLVASQGAAVESAHRQTGLFRYHSGGGPGSEQKMIFQYILMFSAPFNNVLLLVVMGNQSDIFLFPDRYFDIFIFKHISLPFLLCNNSKNDVINLI
jgi:hypothetical protein